MRICELLMPFILKYYNTQNYLMQMCNLNYGGEDLTLSCSLDNVQARSLSQAMIPQHATGMFRLRFKSLLKPIKNDQIN